MKTKANNLLDYIIGGLLSLLFVAALSFLFLVKKKEIKEQKYVYEEEFLGV